MKLDTQLGQFDLERVANEARKLEEIGFDALWSFEANHNPFLPLTLAALSTTKLKVGTNIAVAFPRSPMITAMVAWDIQNASKGRFMLGLGTQVRAHNERRLSAPSDAPAARVKEIIQCIRAIWDTFQNGSKPSFKGRFYQFTLMTPFFDPGPIEHPRIPIFLAGVQRLMCRTAGEVADGLHVHPMHSVKYLKDLVHPSIAEGAKLSARDPADVELFAPVFAVMGESEAERSRREKEIRDQISFYASTPNYRDVLRVHGWEAVGEELSKLARAGAWDQMGSRITDEMLDAFAVSVPESKLPQVLRERYAGVAHRVAIYHPLPEDAPAEPWRAFVKAFQSASA